MISSSICRSPSKGETRPEIYCRNGHESNYQWEIENFSMCPQKKGEALFSTTFTVDSLDQSEFRLVLYPRGEAEDETENVKCYLECLIEPDYTISVAISVLTSNNSSTVTKSKVRFIIRNGDRIGFVLLPDRKELVTRKSVLLPNDVFTLRCVVVPQYRAPFVCDDDFQDISNAIAYLFESGNFSDFVIVGDAQEEFHVHKVILAIRGPELARSFGLMDDKPVNEARIGNIRTPVLHAILCYLYSGYLKDDLTPDVLNDVYEVSRRLNMDDLKRDVFPVETSINARTIIKVDRRTISWTLTDFHRRVNDGDWPIRTFVDLTIGRFLISFALMEREGVVFTQITIYGPILLVQGSILIKCNVLVDPRENGPKTELCSMERWFDYQSGESNTFIMNGDHDLLYAWKSLKQYPEKMTLVFEFALASAQLAMDCHKVGVNNSLVTPNPSCKRSLERLSSDLDIVFRDTIEEEENDSDSDRDPGTFSDVRIRSRNGKLILSHRCVLAARSERFKALIVSDGIEKKLTNLDIIDMSDETLNDLLRYIYSGKIKDRDLSKIADLYIAANYYMVRGLVKRCACFMKTKMTSSDIYRLMVLAEDFQDENLFKMLLDFICLNRISTLNSTEWQKVVSERPHLASRTLSELSSRLSNGT